MMEITAAIIAAGRAVGWAIGHRAMYAFVPDLTYNSTGRWRGGARGRLVFLFFYHRKKYIFIKITKTRTELGLVVSAAAVVLVHSSNINISSSLQGSV